MSSPSPDYEQLEAGPSRSSAGLHRPSLDQESQKEPADPRTSEAAPPPLTWFDCLIALLVCIPRFLLCLALALVVGAVSALLLLFASVLVPHRWRQARSVRLVLCTPISLLCRIGLLSAGFYVIKEEGSLCPSASIVVANHSSAADVLWATWRVLPCFVAKAEARSIPYVGAAAAALGCIFVDRASSDSRLQVRKAMAGRCDRPDGSPPLLVFPEGTTSKSLLVFQNGAFATGLPVQPLAICFPAQQLKPDTLAGSCAMWLRPVSRMSVNFLPLYTPSAEERAAPALFAENVRRALASTLDVPLSSQRYTPRTRNHAAAAAAC
jgi:1-acyl-sn-glycerol-3-phosphate acyltransferase